MLGLSDSQGSILASSTCLGSIQFRSFSLLLLPERPWWRCEELELRYRVPSSAPLRRAFQPLAFQGEGQTSLSSRVHAARQGWWVRALFWASVLLHPVVTC